MLSPTSTGPGSCPSSGGPTSKTAFPISSASKPTCPTERCFAPRCLKERSASRFLSFSPPPERWFSDIVNAIAMIDQFTSGMDFEAFRSSPMAVAAVERKLQIISEAATRLGNEAEQRIPDQPWRDIRGIGNQLRHAYERIDLNTIWNAVTDDLPPLKAAVVMANPTGHLPG